MKRLRVFLLPPGWMLVHRRVTPSIKFAGTHLYTWLERGTVGVKCLAQEHNTMSPPVLEPGPLAPVSSALTMRPPRLPLKTESCRFNTQHIWYTVLHIKCLLGVLRLYYSQTQFFDNIMLDTRTRMLLKVTN